MVDWLSSWGVIDVVTYWMVCVYMAWSPRFTVGGCCAAV